MPASSRPLSLSFLFLLSTYHLTSNLINNSFIHCLLSLGGVWASRGQDSFLSLQHLGQCPRRWALPVLVREQQTVCSSAQHIIRKPQ